MLQVVAKFATNASGTSIWLNLQPITYSRFMDLIAWVRYASGNVFGESGTVNIWFHVIQDQIEWKESSDELGSVFLFHVIFPC